MAEHNENPLGNDVDNDVDNDDDTDDAARAHDAHDVHDEHDAGGTSTLRRLPWWVPALAGVVIGAIVIGLAMLWSDRNDLSDRIDRRADIETTASEFTSAILTYDYTDLDAVRERLDGLATETLRDEYVNGLDDSLRSLLIEAQAQSSVEILDVYSSDTEGDTATAIVLARTDVSSTTSAAAEVTSHVEIDLVRVDGRWLVNEMRTLTNQGQAVGADGEPVAPPETPVTPTTADTVPEETSTTVGG